MGHHHDHGHGGHGHPVAGWRYGVGIALNLLIVAVQLGAGFAVGSTALLADAGHNASDVVGLLLAGGAAWLATRPGAEKRTYGFGKAGVLAALVNCLLLLLASGAILAEAASRLLGGHAATPPGGVVMAVAALGILVNGGSAWLLSGGQAGDVNRRAAVLHLLADAAVSAGVVVAGALMLWTGAAWIDPLASVLIVGVIVAGSWRLLRESLDLAMDSAPAHIDVGEVRAWLMQQPGVAAVHDLHIWPISATEPALTAHLVRPAGSDDAVLHALQHGLRARFGIGHATLQLETSHLHECEHLPC
ncbi:cation diffusion facilitator family transporter [Sandaracinobacteroides saxicola]|nr:cation diffusion facilitator family transporter [Sandaracinobacteroides saxicola]